MYYFLNFLKYQDLLFILILLEVHETTPLARVFLLGSSGKLIKLIKKLNRI